MAGIFQGLELGKRALLSHQYSLTTAGHNIANASTPGYSRQRLHLTSTDPLKSNVGILGSGVQVGWIRHVRDDFLTHQYRQGNDQLGRWSSLEQAMVEIEHVFNEPSDLGFTQTLNDFFASWQTLSQTPESSAARAAVREQAVRLTNAFHQFTRRLSDIERNLDQEIVTRIGMVNEISAEIANLNREISRSELNGTRANDLRDRRDFLIDDLSKMVNVSVVENSKGAARVFIGAMEVVGGSSYSPLDTESITGISQAHSRIVWKNSSVGVDIQGGELDGLLEARDDILSSYRSMLDDLAGKLVTEINALHRAGSGLDGSTGTDFFDPAYVTADKIALDGWITTDLNRIAASQSGAVGDNANALAIADLQNSLLLNDGLTTFSEFYAEIVSATGRRTAEAEDARQTSALLVEQVELSRQSVQGVSLDEEMAEMIKAQHAYDAAARVVSTMDRALDTLINDMGVGR